MKRTLCLILLAALMLFNTAACATDLEIVYQNVNFRGSPGGSVIGRFDGGEILTALDETWANDQLWYHAHSETLGDGYVSGEYARPVLADERVFDPENPTQTDHVTENVLAFYEAFQRYLYDNGFCYWNAEENICAFRVNNTVGDPTIVRPSMKLDLASMLLKYGLLVENGDTELLRGGNGSDEKMLRISSAILKKHFGTDDIWPIVFRLLRFSEAHLPHGELSTNDLAKTSEVWEKVNAEYSRQETGPADHADTDAGLVLYYNPEGGTFYHTDMNCPSTAAKYLPFSGSFTWAQVNDAPYTGLKPCTVCGAPARKY